MKKKKTELCVTFMNRGYCSYGSTCSFAHGYSELQAKTHLNWNHKVKDCKNFFQKGYCEFGERCNFSHRQACQRGREILRL